MEVAKEKNINFKGLDYYPFGMEKPGRSFASGEYKYGFNGMEKDDEVKGSGNSYTTEFRQFDPRLARWLSLDPVLAVWESPYAGFRNNPVYFEDPSGDCPDCPEKIGEDKATVAIDAGHGIDGSNNPSMDRGAAANGYSESDLTLAISKSVNANLQTLGENTEMIRDGELIVDGNSLTYRTDKAKEAGADIFVSIHINSAGETSSGFTVLYKDGGTNDEKNEALATSIANNQFTMPLKGDGTTVRNDLAVLNNFSTTGPAVLVEVGFITNPNDVQLMTTKADDIGKEIAKGIYLFITGGVPPLPPPIDTSIPGNK